MLCHLPCIVLSQANKVLVMKRDSSSCYPFDKKFGKAQTLELGTYLRDLGYDAATTVYAAGMYRMVVVLKVKAEAAGELTPCPVEQPELYGDAQLLAVSKSAFQEYIVEPLSENDRMSVSSAEAEDDELPLPSDDGDAR